MSGIIDQIFPPDPRWQEEDVDDYFEKWDKLTPGQFIAAACAQAQVDQEDRRNQSNLHAQRYDTYAVGSQIVSIPVTEGIIDSNDES